MKNIHSVKYQNKIQFQVALLPSAGQPSTNKLTNETREKQMRNELTISGTVKNLKTYTNERGTLLTGWLDQRDVSRLSDGTADRATYVVGMNIIALDDSVIGDILGTAKAGAESTQLITLTGRMVTKFDRRQNVAENLRRAPFAQLEVHAIEVNA